MSHRSPARWLAPLALVVFAIALVSALGVLSGSGDAGETAAQPDAPADATQNGNGDGNGEEAEEASEEDEERPRRRRHYRVQPGDTPSGIAERTGVPLDQIEELNPDLDPQLLSPGDRIRIRP
jgi:hypothetical protein